MVRLERALQSGRIARLVIAAAVLAVYLPSLDHAFQYDDHHSIVENPHLRTLANLDDFFWRADMFSVDPKSAMYRPLVLVSYAVNYAWGEYRVEGYHAFNIAVHLASCLLVYSLVHRSLGSGLAGLASGLLFALHPIAGEPVNYISSRSESLCALFSLVSFTLYIRGREGAALGPYWGSVLAFVGALLAKSLAIVVPLVLVLSDVVAGRMGRERNRYYLPFALVAVAYLAVVRQALKTALVDSPVRGFEVQVLTQAKVLVYYLKLLLVPVDQSVEHQAATASGLGDPPVLAALALLGTLGYGLIWIWRRSRRLFFWTVWPLTFLLPTFAMPLNVLANEHRLYIPAMGLAVLWGRVLTGRIGGGRGLVLLALLVTTYGALSLQRSQVWRTPESLWSDARAKAPLMPRPHLYMGTVYKEQGRHREALTAYQRALTVNPSLLSGADLLALYNNTGAVYLAMGHNEESATWYRRALAIDPDFTKARDALEGLAAIASGAWKPAAEKHYKEGMKLMVAGQPERAVDQLQRALAVQQHGKIYQALGLAYERSGQPDAAIATYRALLRQPGVPASLAQGTRMRLETLGAGGTGLD